MKIFVSGAAGHIGAALVRRLLADGRSVRAAVYKDERALEGLAVEKIACDVDRRESAARALEGVDTVYHCAARIAIAKHEERGMLETNVAGTRNMVEAALAQGVRRFVHFSSIHSLQSQPADAPVDEERPLLDHETAMLYNFSKAEGERIVLGAVKRGLDAVIVNPTGVIGPYDFKPSLMGDFLLLLVNGKLPSLVNGGFNWVDVRDVADGAVRAEKKGKTGERYILGGSWGSVLDISRQVEKLIQRKTMQRTIPSVLAYLGLPFLALAAAVSGRRRLYTHDSLRTLSEYRLVSSRKAERELGYTHRRLEETLRDTIAWFAERGLISGSRKARA